MLIPLLAALLACTHPAPAVSAAPAVSLAASSAARATPPDTGTNVRDLPIIELRAQHVTSPTLAIILSGDGGWADIDQRVGERLQARGVDVIGVDMRDYLRGGKRTPAGIGADVSRIARRYMGLWQLPWIALVGYSRGSDLAPFAAAHLASDVKPRLKLIAFLALLERASFTYHFSDLWRTTSGKGDIPILPVLEELRGTPMLCVYGHDEKESLCRTAPAGLMTVIERPGAHHFDGNYDVLADAVYAAIQKANAR